MVAFEDDADPEKRARWVDRLLDRPEYADLFAMKWSAILRNKRALGDVSQPGTFAFHGWIRQSLAENKPYDRFVAEIVAARGDAERQPAGRLVSPGRRRSRSGSTTPRSSSSGLRIQCARCHHHPFERWSQDDYYGFASLFARVGTKPGTDPTAPRIFILPAGLAAEPADRRGPPAQAARRPPSWPTSARRDPRARWSTGSGSPTTRSSPGPWSTATGSTSSAGAWSSPRTTCG